MAHEAETVRRVVQLVATAKSGKEKKRPINVVDSSGAVKKVVPHIEVIDALLHHEGVSGALEGGIRPKVVLCKHCLRTVNVPPNGAPVPSSCPAHRRGPRRPCGYCGKQTAAPTGRCRGCVVSHAWENMTEQERIAAIKKRLAKTTPESRSDSAKLGNARRDPAERSETARRRRMSKTPEERSAQLRAAWETRRRNAQAKLSPPPPHTPPR